jgi:hypothetical protein
MLLNSFVAFLNLDQSWFNVLFVLYILENMYLSFRYLLKRIFSLYVGEEYIPRWLFGWFCARNTIVIIYFHPPTVISWLPTSYNHSSGNVLWQWKRYISWKAFSGLACLCLMFDWRVMSLVMPLSAVEGKFDPTRHNLNWIILISLIIDLVKPDVNLTWTLLDYEMEQYMVNDKHYKSTT